MAEYKRKDMPEDMIVRISPVTARSAALRGQSRDFSPPFILSMIMLYWLWKYRSQLSGKETIPYENQLLGRGAGGDGQLPSSDGLR